MIKNLIKKFIVSALYLILRPNSDSSLKILAYHRVTQEEDLSDPLKISNYVFDRQVKYLKKNYNIISGEQLLNLIVANEKIPPKSCLITFDDGWKDNYTNAFPILKKYNVPAIIFISTNFIGSNKIFWHERLQGLLRNISQNVTEIDVRKNLDAWPEAIKQDLIAIIKSPNEKRFGLINHIIQDLKEFHPHKLYALNDLLSEFVDIKNNETRLMLTWNEVKEMAEHNVHFGSHTENHRILTQISDDQVKYELMASKSTIEERISKPVYFFSYPNGDYNKSMLEMVKNSGYTAAFAMVSGISFCKKHLFEIKRFMMREDTCLGFRGAFSELLFEIEISGFRRYLKNKLIRKNA